MSSESASAMDVASSVAARPADEEFYLRYYVGHKGKFGHEFLEFEFRPDGLLRYANNSNYKNDTIIRKEVYVSPTVLNEIKVRAARALAGCSRIVVDSDILKEDDANWAAPDAVGRQELEVVVGGEHISFVTAKIGSLVELEAGSADAEGLKIFYFLIQDLRCAVFSLIGMHFKIQPHAR